MAFLPSCSDASNGWIHSKLANQQTTMAVLPSCSDASNGWIHSKLANQQLNNGHPMKLMPGIGIMCIQWALVCIRGFDEM